MLSSRKVFFQYVGVKLVIVEALLSVAITESFSLENFIMKSLDTMMSLLNVQH